MLRGPGKMSASIAPTNDQEKLQNLIDRLERMRGPFMGDGINPGFTTTEVLEYLKPLLEKDLTGS